MPSAPLPNIVILSTHDSGRHFGCYGVPTVQTPNIDRLAGEGVLFTQMFAACPICSPSRGALLTGRYPLANGLVGLAGGSWNWELHDYKQHLSHRLRAEGYQTAMIGLQHETSHIDRMGFDDTSCHGVSGGKTAIQVAQDATAYFETHKADKNPFYAQIGFHETHMPYDFGGCESDESAGAWIPPYAHAHDWAPWESILRRFDGDEEKARVHIAQLQGSLKMADDAVGMILKALDETGLAENTLVLFTTDHGVELPGAKWTMYDPGLGIAFILRWPAGGVVGGRRCDCLLGNVDFLPTLYELIGWDAPVDAQGVSFAAACRESAKDTPSPRTVAFGNWVDGLHFSARTEHYKLIRNLVEVDSTGYKRPPYELYDLQRDPLELTNVAEEPAYADAMNDMRTHLDGWLQTMNDPTLEGPLPDVPHDDMIQAYRERYERIHAS